MVTIWNITVHTFSSYFLVRPPKPSRQPEGESVLPPLEPKGQINQAVLSCCDPCGKSLSI